MTDGVTQAAMPGAAQSPSAGRHGRRDEHAAGAFDEALGAPTPHRAEASAGAKPKADAWRQAGTRPGAGAAALDRATPKDGHARKNGIDDRLTRALARSPDQPDDASADETDPAETGADNGLPTQMRAEQAISAIMTIAPIARQPAPSTAPGPQKEGKAGDASDAEGAASDGSKAARAAGAKLALEQQSQPDAAPGEQAAARRGTRPEGVAADASIQSVATPGHERIQPGSAKAEAAMPAGPQTRPADAADPAADKSTVAVPGQARSGGGNDGADTRQGGSDGRNASREARRAEPLPAAARVSIIAEQAAPAPVAPTLSTNGAAIVNAVGAQQGWRATAHLSSALLGEGQNSAQPMRELKIQLHPLELGVVTAHLRTTGEKLSVELKVDNREAYHRLSADSDAIVKSLRSLGFDIDTVSIQQPQAATTAVARSETDAGTGSFSRDTPSFEPGNSGSGGERFGGQTSGRGERGDAQGNDSARPKSQDRAGSSLYI